MIVLYNQNMNYNKHLTPKEKIQFSLSGIETNLLMTGILLLASVLDSYLSETLIMCANINVLFAILNSLPAMGFDGEKALSAFLGIDSVFSAALYWMLDKRRRKSILNYGFAAYACSGFFCSILITQVFVTLLIIWDYIYFIYSIFTFSF